MNDFVNCSICRCLIDTYSEGIKHDDIWYCQQHYEVVIQKEQDEELGKDLNNEKNEKNEN